MIAMTLDTQDVSAKLRFTATQAAALDHCISLLRSSKPTSLEIGEAYQQLLDSGIPPMVSLNDAIVQSYLDEL